MSFDKLKIWADTMYMALSGHRPSTISFHHAKLDQEFSLPTGTIAELMKSFNTDEKGRRNTGSMHVDIGPLLYIANADKHFRLLTRIAAKHILVTQAHAKHICIEWSRGGQAHPSNGVAMADLAQREFEKLQASTAANIVAKASGMIICPMIELTTVVPTDTTSERSVYFPVLNITEHISDQGRLLELM